MEGIRGTETKKEELRQARDKKKQKFCQEGRTHVWEEERVKQRKDDRETESRRKHTGTTEARERATMIVRQRDRNEAPKQAKTTQTARARPRAKESERERVCVGRWSKEIHTNGRNASGQDDRVTDIGCSKPGTRREHEQQQHTHTYVHTERAAFMKDRRKKGPQPADITQKGPSSPPLQCIVSVKTRSDTQM